MLGLKVMINMLLGGENQAEAVNACVGKIIQGIILDTDADPNVVRVMFIDGSELRAWDDGQSCCESRYMRTDDDLAYHVGAAFRGVTVKDGPTTEGEYGDTHEIQFMEVLTDKGVVSFANHNEHNGYYGGFSLKVKLSNLKEETKS